MRRLVRVALVLAVTIAAVAGAMPAAAENLRIAMVLWRGETAAETGFRGRLAALGYAVRFTVVDAEQNRTTLRSRIESTVMPRLDSFDYVYTFGTTASKMTKSLVRGRVPQLFNIVTDPVTAGLVESLDRPGGNVGGATQVVPLTVQVLTAMKLFPIKSLGLLFNPRESNAMLQRERLQAMARRYGFRVVDLKSPPALDMLRQNLRRLTDRRVTVDAVYLPFDSFLISQAALIGTSLRAAGIKSIGANRSYIAGGALVGVVPDYGKLGAAVANVLDRHRKGEKLERIPVQQIYRTEVPTMVLNETTRAALGLEIPTALLDEAVVIH